MKKLIFAVAVASFVAGPVFAQTPAPAANPPAAAAAAKPAAAPMAAKPAAAAMSADKKAKAADCSKQADTKGLHGKARKKFREECKKS